MHLEMTFTWVWYKVKLKGSLVNETYSVVVAKMRYWFWAVFTLHICGMTYGCSRSWAAQLSNHEVKLITWPFLGRCDIGFPFLDPWVFMVIYVVFPTAILFRKLRLALWHGQFDCATHTCGVVACIAVSVFGQESPFRLVFCFQCTAISAMQYQFRLSINSRGSACSLRSWCLGSHLLLAGLNTVRDAVKVLVVCLLEHIACLLCRGRGWGLLLTS